MFRDYKKGDDLLLNANEFSDTSYIERCLNGKYKAKTFEDNGDILCITLYFQYIVGHYVVLSLVSRDIQVGQVASLKKAIHVEAKASNARTFLTFCNKGGKLDRWHEFVGFKKNRKELSERAINMTRWILIWD